MAHIRKRGKTYSYTVDMGVDPVTGKRRQLHKGGFTRKKDAEAAARKVELSLDENRFIEPSKKKFSDFIDEWFNNHYKNRIRNTTAVSRRYLIEKHILQNNSLCNKAISEISTADLDAYYNEKLALGYSGSYVRQIHQIINRAFDQAVRWKKLSENPAVDTDPPSIRKKELPIWSIAHIQTFLAACRKEPHYVTFLLAIYTGMRKGEILGLRWDDVDMKNGKIQVNKSLSYIPEEGYQLGSLKTPKSKRLIPIPEFVINELITHKGNQNNWKRLVGESFVDQDLVICTAEGSAVDPRNLSRVMNRIVRSVNVPKIRFHDLRHTHASILVSKGVDVVRISARMGHANPKITLEYYAHLLPNENDDVADIFHNAIQDSSDIREDKDDKEM
ncbi:site-specific integrase [Sporosarcina highlanderae]|uniref:Site-specific integrase n=1 Tax=Sporosarcina highlanderae TaxID=3035916 RepID=A0ABT8JSH9_9BACL|nr:site-specific integrase [Sporosarcina highlanderae]MDN4607962.1 site-specific integrase [Sporosarcina highlanderae]